MSFEKRIFTNLYEQLITEKLVSDEEFLNSETLNKRLTTNFANIFLIIEKQIQKAFFQALIEVFPSLVFNDQGNTCYNLFFLYNDNKTFFLSKDITQLVKEERDFILEYLQESIKEKTGYTVSLFNIDLVVLKNEFKQVFSDNKQHKELNAQKTVKPAIEHSDLLQISLNLTEDLPFVQDLINSDKKMFAEFKFFDIFFDKSINKEYTLCDDDLKLFFKEFYAHLSTNELKCLISLINKKLKKLGFLRKRTRINQTNEKMYDSVKNAELHQKSRLIHAFHNIRIKNFKKTT